MTKPESHFDVSRAELFEALGHPMRVRILNALETRPMGFADLKKQVGIESSGHLQFHLGKLAGLIETSPDGSYVLSDDGREAIRVLNLTGVGNYRNQQGQRPLFNGRTNWTKPLIAGLLILVIVLSGLAVYQQQARLTSPRTVTITQPVPCAGQVAWSTSSNQSQTPVLLMQPNSTAYACVTYQTYWMGNSNYNFTGSGGAPSGTFQFSPFFVINEVCTQGYGCAPIVSNSFRVSVTPGSVGLSTYTNYVTVLYTITALANSTGYYSNSVPYQACSSMPMAVGHSASNVNRSDFGPLVSPASCGILRPLYPVLVTVSGMDVTYLT